mmetsp:Transcript_33840/g.86841  ORF Transcript_33840/g.86841 Transcript_33840/m.86841 type:complete len:316 (-) Transcript_33840:330-1277(-)
MAQVVVDAQYFEAAKEDDADLLLGLILSGADINAKDDLGYTALHWAAEQKCENVVRVLLSQGAAVNAKSRGGWTPLHKAVQSRNHSIVKQLIEAKADVNARNKFGWTPLHKAAKCHDFEIIPVLIAAGADPYLTTVQDKKSIFDIAGTRSGYLHSIVSAQHEKEVDSMNSRIQAIYSGDAGRQASTEELLRNRVDMLERDVRGLKLERDALRSDLEKKEEELETRAKEEPRKEKRNSSWECIICYDQAPDCVLIPCGHLCYCSGCAAIEVKRCQGHGPESIGNGLTSIVPKDSNSWNCPMCRATVWHVARVYFPE